MSVDTLVTSGHHTAEASDWIRKWSHLLPPSSTVLDVACGSGRHMKWFQERGHHVTGIDRSAAALVTASQWGRVVEADLEQGTWPLQSHQPSPLPSIFDAVVVCNYLWRPLFPSLRASVRPGGWVFYETFSAQQASIGRPSNPDFLLQPKELLTLFAGFNVMAYEDTYLDHPARFVQRIVATHRLNMG